MIKTLDYKIESSTSSVELGKFVMEKLIDGYELLGRPFPNHKGSICQCVVKVDKSDELEKVQQVLNSIIDAEKKNNPMKEIVTKKGGSDLTYTGR